MIIGKPKNISEYICVNSEQSIELHMLGFIPIYRELGKDNIYYYKTDELDKVVKEKWHSIIK